MMLDPLIPYFTIPDLPLAPAGSFGHAGPITAKPFGILVVAGGIVGWVLGARQAKRLGLNHETFNSIFVAIMAGGLLGGHAFDVLLYHPERASHARSLFAALVELASFWGTQSSFGGFLGAFLGLAIWRRNHPGVPAMAYADTIASVFPCAWALGRTGCTVAHDHPGMRSDLWFAVQYPGGGRLDLGLLELAFTVPLAIAFLLWMRKPRTPGFFLAILCLAYAPVRFALDFLRARDVADADPRSFGLTPAQWLSFAMLAAGAALAVRVRRTSEAGTGRARTTVG